MSHLKKSRMLSVVIVADCELVRLGVREVLRSAFKQAHIVEASIHDAWKTCLQKRPQIVIVDLDDCHRNLSFLREVKTFGKSNGVVALTIFSNHDFIRTVYCAGASAVILKQQSRDTLVAAIQKVSEGEVWIDRATLEEVLEAPSPQASLADIPPGGIASLTQREREVLTTIAKGYRNKQIAHELGISEVTVRHHLTAIFGKLGVSDRLELLIFAHSHGLVELKYHPTGVPSGLDAGPAAATNTALPTGTSRA